MKISRFRLTDLTIIGVLLLVSVIVIGIPAVDYASSQNLFAVSFPLTTEAYSALINSLGSLVLTFGLVLMYAQLVRTQERQEEWMEAEHTPDVSVDWWNPTKNEFEVDLTNPGNGAAKNIRLEFNVEAISGAVPDSHVSLEGGAILYRGDITSRMIPAKQTETIAFETRGAVQLTLKTVPSYRPAGIGDTSEYTANFDEVIDILWRDGVDFIDYSLNIRYDYIKRHEDTVRFYSGTSDIYQGMHLEDLVNGTDPDENVEMIVVPEISKEV